MYIPRAETFREDQLPSRLGGFRMPRWASALLFGGLFVFGALGSAAAFADVVGNTSAMPLWVAIALLLTAPSAAIIGGILLWYAGEWLTLTQDEAIVTKALIGRTHIARSQLQDVQSYLHRYASRGGVRYRMVPTLTIADTHDRLRDIPLQFLSYRDPTARGDAPPSANAAYLDAWARGGSSPYARAAAAGTVPEAVAAHRRATRSGIRRRAIVSSILVPTLSIGLGLGIGFGLGPVSSAFGWNAGSGGSGSSGSGGSADAQTDRSGVRDLSDSLTPRMLSYQWTEQPTTPGTTDVQLLPQLASMPASGTLDYFVRDPAQRSGTGLSPEERKLGRIVSEGTIAETGQWIQFALDHGDTKFTLELYVTEPDGHTTRDSAVYENIGGPGPTQTPASP